MKNMEQMTIETNGVRLNVWVGGNGKPLVLLHGFPLSSILWRKIAPELTNEFTVVCPDLRGYGDSGKPKSGYDKRTMALDIKLLMKNLGFERFGVVGHDRGGRVAHRLALDHPESVEKLCVLDIVPTHTIFSKTNKELATAYWHWYFFLAEDLPEMLFNFKPEEVFHFFINTLGYRKGVIEESALQEYIRVIKTPGTIRAMLEDYRAAATIDYELDEQDLGKLIECPLLVIWGKQGVMERMFDVVSEWEKKAKSVTGFALPSGHFIPEEAPNELLNEIRKFFLH